MNKHQLVAILERKGISPTDRCSFVHGRLPGSPSCLSPAVAVVIEHRGPRDVVLGACSDHAAVFFGEEGFTVFSFDHLKYLGDEDVVR